MGRLCLYLHVIHVHELTRNLFLREGAYMVSSRISLHDIHMHELARNLCVGGIYVCMSQLRCCMCGQWKNLFLRNKPRHGNMGHFGPENTGSMCR